VDKHSVPPLTSVARLVLARNDAITGPPLEPAPQKQLKAKKKTSKHPWSRPKRGGAGHPTSVAQIGVGGLWISTIKPEMQFKEINVLSCQNGNLCPYM
jgi:hypothetical protein